jgi:hypothetical protein
MLVEAVPALATAPMLALPSASASIFVAGTDQRLRGLTGIRIYVWVERASDIPMIGARIHQRLMLGGRGFAAVTAAGAVRVKSVLDTSVWQPERLDYAAGAACGEGLEQRRAPRIWNDAAAPLALEEIPSLTDEEGSRLAAIEAGLRATVHDRATKQRQQHATSRAATGHPVRASWSNCGAIEYLDGEHAVRLQSGEWVTVDEILREPARYHDVECYDPLEPDYDGGRVVGKVYAKDAMIHSFAHGGINYPLRASASEEFGIVSGAPSSGAPVARLAWARTFDSVNEGVETLNREFAVLRNGNILHTPASGGYEIMSTATFRTFTANARVPDVRKGTRALSTSWLAAPERRTASGLAFDPTQPVLSYVPGNNGDIPLFNTWPGLAIEPSKEGSCSCFLDHLLRVVAKGDKRVYRWLIHWLAAIVQHPERLPGTALALRGPHGAGKDIIGEVLRFILGALYVNVSNPEQLIGNFNTALAHTVFVHVEETFFAADPRVRGPLKNLITSPTLRINPKGLAPYVVNNCAHLFMSSNEAHFAPVEEGDRRYMVVEVSGERAHDLEYHAALRREMFEEGGCARLLRFLGKVRIDWSFIRRPLATEAHSAQKLASLPADRAFLYNLLEEGSLPGEHRADLGGVIVDKQDLFDRFASACRLAGHRRATPSELTKLLKRCGVSDYRRSMEPRTRYYLFPPLAEMRAEFERSFGAPVDWTPQDGWNCEIPAGWLIPLPLPRLVNASADAGRESAA